MAELYWYRTRSSAHWRMNHIPRWRFCFAREFRVLAEGGTLGFGLRHVYPNDEELSKIYGALNGIDAVVYRSARTLRFEPVLYLYYEMNGEFPEDGLIEFPLDLDCAPEHAFDDLRILRSDVNGGIVVCKQLEWYRASLHFQERREKVEWVTPKTTSNSRQSPYAANIGGDGVRGPVSCRAHR